MEEGLKDERPKDIKMKVGDYATLFLMSFLSAATAIKVFGWGIGLGCTVAAYGIGAAANYFTQK